MPLLSVRVGLSRTQASGDETPVGEAVWRAPDLPSRGLFVETLRQLYGEVELPSFPSRAWAEAETDVAIRKVEDAEPVDDPEAVAGRLWAWVLAAGQGCA